MKIALPNSDIPGYKKKIHEELSKLIEHHDNCTRLECYVETNGEMYPELSGLYESLVDISISNVELNHKSNTYAYREEVKDIMLRQRPNYMKNMPTLHEIDLEAGGEAGTGIGVKKVETYDYWGGGGGGDEKYDKGEKEEWCVII